MILILSTTTAHADRLYRVTPIKQISIFPNPDTYGRIGMNNLGEIVYGDGSAAFLYLPSANYNLAAGIHNLNSISDRTGTTHARGINDYGFIVGTYGGDKVLEGEAIVWNMNQTDGNGKYVTTLLDTNDEFLWSGAFGVSNHATNPLIVGIGGILGSCTCSDPAQGGGSPELRRRAFAIRLDDTPLDTSHILETSAENSVAWDVTEEDETVVGRFNCVGDNCPIPDPFNCDEVPEAIVWIEGDATMLEVFATGLGETRGTNANAELVGSSYETDDTCFERAAYWANGAGDLVVLGNRLPSGVSTIESVSLAINVPSSGPTQVVGYSPNVGAMPLLFQQEGCTEPCTDEEEWVGYSLNDMTLGGTPVGESTRLWVIRDAHNINNNGTIVVWALKDGSFDDSYVVRLDRVPNPDCLADISNTGTQNQVNVFDLFVLLSNWGPCQDGVPCTADLTDSLGLPNSIDGVVDVFDLFYLLGNWDLCSASYDVELDEDECYEKFDPGTPELEACIESVAIANGYIEE